MIVLDELKHVLAALDEATVPYALCGGLAMADHGFPRATVDIDELVEEGEFPRVAAAVAPLGFTIHAHRDDIEQLEGKAE